MKINHYAFPKAIAVVLIAVQFLGWFPAATFAQSRDCRQMSITDVVSNPSQYGKFNYGRMFIPPWVRGDRDFNGHGPMYKINVKLWYTALGIYADVYMDAWEVDDNNRPQWDFTETKGSSRLWFYTPPIGWELSQFAFTTLANGVGQVTYRLDSSTEHINGLSDVSASLNLESRDKNGHDRELAGLHDDGVTPEVLGTVDITGDTDGEDAGIATGIAIGLPFNPMDWLQLCRIRSPFHWSSAGPIPGMLCTQVYEPNEPAATTWNDNYFCSTLPVGKAWSHRGPISGMNCVQWYESREPAATTWNDNYLCFSKESWPYNNFKYAWSSAGPIRNMICTQIFESREPPETTWNDNYFCFYPLPPR